MSRAGHTADGLTRLQRAFVEAVVGGKTGAAAARAAGYAGTASSIKTTASHLMRHEGVIAALRARGFAPRSRGRQAPDPAPPRPPDGPLVPLTTPQLLAVEVLIGGGTHAAAAEAAAVTRETMARWVSDPSFRAELDAQRLASLERARLRVEGLADDALAVAAAVLAHAGRCAECGADCEPPGKDAQTMALAMLDRAGVGSRALDVPALRARMRDEAVGELAAALKTGLSPEVYRQVLAVVRVEAAVVVTEPT